MPLVDSLLKLMSAQNADAIIISATEPPTLERKGEPRSLSMPALGTDMVEAMVEELLDPAALALLRGGETIETSYEGDHDGPYRVRVEPGSDGVRLTLRHPEPADVTSSPPADQGPPATASAPPQAAFPAAPAGADPPSAHPSAPPPESTSTPPAANTAPLTLGATKVTGLEPLVDRAPLDPGPLAAILAQAEREDASDILLSHGCNARLRVAGEIMELGGHPIDEAELRAFITPILGDRARHDLNHLGHSDLALRIRHGGQLQRYRGNLFLQRGGLSLALRPVRRNPPTLDLLNLPEELASLATLPRGLVLMTGTAGSGKSTTLVALIEHINRSAPKHVITLEDPIEYEYENRRALVHQRQVGTHVRDFGEGLRAALRESPDVILVGEMRDHATIAAALTAAETGHLVLSTLHAGDAAMAVDRIIDSFPEHQQNQIRFQLAGALRAVVTQRLIASAGRPARVPAIELLRVNTAVATKIREGRGHQLQSEIQKGRADGMLSFELTLARLVRRGLLSPQAAMAHASDQALMADHLGDRRR